MPDINEKEDIERRSESAEETKSDVSKRTADTRWITTRWELWAFYLYYVVSFILVRVR